MYELYPVRVWLIHIVVFSNFPISNILIPKLGSQSAATILVLRVSFIFLIHCSYQSRPDKFSYLKNGIFFGVIFRNQNLRCSGTEHYLTLSEIFSTFEQAFITFPTFLDSETLYHDAIVKLDSKLKLRPFPIPS